MKNLSFLFLSISLLVSLSSLHGMKIKGHPSLSLTTILENKSSHNLEITYINEQQKQHTASLKPNIPLTVKVALIVNEIGYASTLRISTGSLRIIRYRLPLLSTLVA